jgi:Holliday junction resolvase RusA-like endonuclease
VIIRLPMPPTVNQLYFNVPKRGRVKTTAYTKWIEQADRWCMVNGTKGGVKGPYELHIRAPKSRGDIDGRIKAIADFLVSRRFTSDDKHMLKTSIEVDESLSEFCEITITPVPRPPFTNHHERKLP